MELLQHLGIHGRKCDLVRQHFSERNRQLNAASERQAQERLYHHYQNVGISADFVSLAAKYGFTVMVDSLLHHDWLKEPEKLPVLPALAKLGIWTNVPVSLSKIEPADIPRFDILQLKKYFPDRPADMTAIRNAIIHGCAAHLDRQAWEDVYWPRILRYEDFFITRQLGSHALDLEMLSPFFEELWTKPSQRLLPQQRTVAVARAAAAHMAIGRMREAVQCCRLNFEYSTQSGEAENILMDAEALCAALIAIGDLPNAKSIITHVCASYSTDHKSNGRKEALAQAGWLHFLMGDPQGAHHSFRVAEGIQARRTAHCPMLQSGLAYLYHKFLIDQGHANQVIDRVAKLKSRHFSRPNQVLYNVNLASAKAKLNSTAESNYLFEEPVLQVRSYGSVACLVDVLLTRAEFLRERGEFEKADADLTEVHDIAVRGGLKLAECDCLLERVRLALARNPDPSRDNDCCQLTQQLAIAATIAEESSYCRVSSPIR